jgi:hypothetical protein
MSQSVASTSSPRESTDLLLEQGILMQRRHLSDLDVVHTVAKAVGIAEPKIPRRRLRAALDLIDEERDKLRQEIAAAAL